MNISLTPFPELTTNRLLLRKLVMSDRDALQQLRSDDRVNKYLDRPKSLSNEECEAHIRRVDELQENNQCIYWVIALKENNELIGATGYRNFSSEHELAEIGYELSPEHQGKGLMQEALTKLIEYGFDTMQLKIIIAVPKPENEKSVRLIKRNNFKLDADYRYADKESSEGHVVYFLKRD